MIFPSLSVGQRGMLGVLLSAAVAFGAGCGKTGEHETAKVSGIVTLNGDPMKFGSLLFVPEGDYPSAEGSIRSDGTFEMGTYTANDGAVIAKHKVIITARVASGSSLPEDAVKGAAGTVSAIPERYGDLEKSGLVANVESGDNTINFDLTSAAKPAE